MACAAGRTLGLKPVFAAAAPRPWRGGSGWVPRERRQRHPGASSCHWEGGWAVRPQLLPQFCPDRSGVDLRLLPRGRCGFNHGRSLHRALIRLLTLDSVDWLLDLASLSCKTQ